MVFPSKSSHIPWKPKPSSNTTIRPNTIQEQFAMKQLRRHPLRWILTPSRGISSCHKAAQAQQTNYTNRVL